MTDEEMRRRNKNYGDSPVRRSGVPITSSVLEGCSLLPTLAAGRQFASATRGTASRLPFGSTVESWPPQPSACPRPSPSLCRALLMQPGIARASGSLERRQDFVAARVGLASSLKKRQRLSVLGVPGKKLVQHLAECCSRVELGKDGQPAQPYPMDQQIAGWQVQLHCNPT
jgi:hypothetical protein